VAAFLDPVFGWPSVARFSWAPAKAALEEAPAMRCFWPDEEQTGGGQQQQKMSSFFAASSGGGGGGGGGGGAPQQKGTAISRSAWMRRRFCAPEVAV